MAAIEQLTDEQILEKIKTGLGIDKETNYQDDVLQFYIDDARAFMIDAGVPEVVTRSSVAVGCLLRGVNDLWDYGNGTAQLSDYFKMRVTQLATQTTEETETQTSEETETEEPEN